MKFGWRWLPLAVGLAGLAVAQKQVDIGATEAPLSASERTELDQAVRKHDYTAEKAVMDRALAEHADSFELRIMTGRLSYLEKHPKESADALLAADKIRPIGETDRLTLALGLSFSDRERQSKLELEKLIQSNPRNAEYHYLLGRVESNAKHLEDAAAEFAKAAELDPGMVRAYEALGRTQDSLNLSEEAKKTFELGAAKNRENKVHWEWSPIDLGIVLLKANDLAGAERLFREALLYNPISGQGHYYLGQVFLKQGNEAEAMLEYKAAVIHEPRLKEAWLALGRQFTREGNKAEAERALGNFKKLEAEENARQGRKN